VIMTLGRFRRSKPIALLIILTLACSLTIASPSRASSKRRSTGKVVKKKSQKRVAGRGKVRARKRSKRPRRRVIYVRVRGRNGRYRWVKRYVRGTPQYTRTAIQSFLTESWTNAQAEAARTEPPGPSSEAGAGQPTSVASTAASENASAAPPPGAEISVPADGTAAMNPLVYAYTESLSLRGFDPDAQGFIVQTLNGEVLAEHNADESFNPASVVKVATSLVAVSKLGPNFRFRTSLYTDGTLDPSTGTLNGSLYVIGSGDPAFFFENALLIADKLNRSGIRVVNGNLVVLGQFYFNLSASREAAAASFRKTLTPETWTPGVKSAYTQFLAMREAEERNNGVAGEPQTVNLPSSPPSLKITGKTITNASANTGRLHLLAVHTSLPLLRVLKGLNDFSNNWMATVIGNMVGGPYAVQAFLRTEVGLKDDELSIITPSGLGSNLISPRATIHILQKLVTYLQKSGLGIEDILPVAGVDAGTLYKRFNDSFRGSVVAKTGTLKRVSALAGVAYTRGRGPLLFVIYNRDGSVYSFRAAQDETIKSVISFYGGPAPVRYSTNGGPRVSERMPDGQSPLLSSPK